MPAPDLWNAGGLRDFARLPGLISSWGIWFLNGVAALSRLPHVRD
jgi:hypothetical protein